MNSRVLHVPRPREDVHYYSTVLYSTEGSMLDICGAVYFFFQHTHASPLVGTHKSRATKPDPRTVPSFPFSSFFLFRLHPRVDLGCLPIPYQEASRWPPESMSAAA